MATASLWYHPPACMYSTSTMGQEWPLLGLLKMRLSPLHCPRRPQIQIPTVLHPIQSDNTTANSTHKMSKTEKQDVEYSEGKTSPPTSPPPQAVCVAEDQSDTHTHTHPSESHSPQHTLYPVHHQTSRTCFQFLKTSKSTGVAEGGKNLQIEERSCVMPRISSHAVSG